MQQVLTWTISGLVAGWLTGVATKGRGLGLIASLALGLAGGFVGGWVFGALGISPGAGSAAHMLVGLNGGVLLVVAVRSVANAARLLSPAGTARTEPPVDDILAALGRLDTLEKRVFSQFLKRRPVSTERVPHPGEERLSFGDHLADELTAFGGSWTFIVLSLVALALWVVANSTSAHPFDPFPFILLNLVLSCVAAFQAPVIMMSQNRQAVRDRADAQHDYQVNLKAELEILALHAKVDELRERDWQNLLAIQQQQLELLERLRGVSAADPASADPPLTDRGRA
jgi:uncharacterized membrane protein/uncharacterized membrane protein YeaQ/YmgE (transglycosylase-associated protein family)